MQSSIQKDPRFLKAHEGSEDFRGLSEEHMRLKKEAADFNKAKFLTSEDEQKMHDIKKRKLEIKDKMEQLMQEFNG